MFRNTVVMLCMVIALASCTRVIEAPLPGADSYRKTVAVRIKSEEKVLDVKESNRSTIHRPSETLASAVGFLTLGQAGESQSPDIKSEYIDESHRYAMACSNAYKHGVYKNNQFLIPGWSRVERYDNRLGSAADVYEVEGGERVIIAFRGTEFRTLKDWMYGNFNIIYPGQYKEAQLVYRLVRQKYGNQVKIVTTGHSLGAGLALNCARNNPEVDAVVFDASPRVFSYARYPSSQLHIVEKGEIMTLVRTVWRYIPPNAFNPLVTRSVDYFDGSRLQQHNMYHLAFAILNDAARKGNVDAQKGVKVNPVYAD